MKSVLVTGATGGLGRNAVDSLLLHGVHVHATGRNPTVGALLQAQGAQFTALDLATAPDAELHRLVQGVDTVWHCAALSAPWGPTAQFVAANVTATQRLLQAAGRSGSVQRFVHISTPALYFDFRHHLSVREDYRPARYVNTYARTKAQAEQCVQEAVQTFAHMHCTLLRPRAIFGRYDQVLIPRLQRVMQRNAGRLPLPRGGQVLLDVTYADNVVHAMHLASASTVGYASGSVFNITNHAPTTLRAVLERLFVQEMQQSLRILNVPYPLLATVARGMEGLACLSGREPALTAYSVGALAFDMTLCNQRAQAVLGYHPPVGLEQAIAHTAQWLTHHG